MHEVHASPEQMQLLEQVRAEGAGLGVRALGTKVALTQYGATQTTVSSLDALAQWAGGPLPIDRVQAIKLVTPGGDAIFLFVAWSGARALMHELASLLPGTLATNLRVRRPRFGILSTLTFESDRGEGDPIAQAATADAMLTQGIVWDWVRPHRQIALEWGLQAVPFAADRTLHLMHTGSHDFSLRVYLERRLAFVRFMRKVGSSPPPPMRLDPVPLASVFLADITER